LAAETQVRGREETKHEENFGEINGSDDGASDKELLLKLNPAQLEVQLQGIQERPEGDQGLEGVKADLKYNPLSGIGIELSPKE